MLDVLLAGFHALESHVYSSQLGTLRCDIYTVKVACRNLSFLFNSFDR